ncbi:P-type ATPase [Thoreauomyces humboldtii]|nr:P-type ATPase [Thoreauomyces humboldtii]
MAYYDTSEADLRSVSVRLDGRASIEHQIDIHVLDLVDAAENSDISLDDVLQGLKYVTEYRIKGGKMRNLDGPLMERLLEGLLQNMGHQQGNLVRQRPTPEADMAFVLFGELLEEVEEFRLAVAKKSATDLRHCLKIHRRCQPSSTPEQREDAAGVLALLMRYFPVHDWKDLVDSEEHDDALKLMKDFKEKFEHPAMPPADHVMPPQALYFDKNVVQLAEMFGTSIETGLTSAKIEELTDFYGSNQLPTPPRESVFRMLWTQVTDFMVLILIAAAVAQFATSDPKAGTVLLIVVVMNVTIGFVQEYKANKALEALLSLTVPKATVLRDGKKEIVDSAVLVPGDIVVLEEGDAIPADLRLCEVAQLEVIEIILTGEALGVPKSTRTIRKRARRLPLGDCKGNAFMTTVVARGRAKGIVVRTGNNTEIGRISKAITAAPKRKTILQIKLARLGKWLVALSIGLCALIIVIGILYKQDTLEVIKVGVSLAVSVIPEGLVAVVTVTMALGVVRMARRNAIVRKLPSVETLGSVNIICSDKTGTLTEGKMGTAQLWTSDNALFTFTHSTDMDPNVGNARVGAYLPLDEALADPKSTAYDEDNVTGGRDLSKTLEDMPSHLLAGTMASSLCNNSSISWNEDAKAWKMIGDPTEVAMIIAAQKVGFPREWFQDSLGLKKIGEYAFDSDRKLMSVICQQSEKSSIANTFPPSTSFVFTKGAPEGVLSKSTHYLPPSPPGSRDPLAFLNDMTPEPMTDAFVELVSHKASTMASRGLRVLALAMRKVSPAEAQEIILAKKESAAERELVFIGLIGLIDPAKAGVKESVEICRRAGIRVVMITGDHIATASAIAKQLGILDPARAAASRAMKGYEIDLLSEEQLAALKPFPVVFARVSPDNKLKIVKALQSKGFSVAMTGDGVNDAPAIKQADVGVAMGISGTEITKQAADIVLADDNFSTIVDAVREGRGVFDNIQKFVVYLLSCNSAEIFLFLICAIINEPTPFTTIQILWANIIADVPPAMSLGVEPHELDIMSRRPRSQTEGVLTVPSSLLVLSQGFMMAGLTFGTYMISRDHGVGGATTLEQQRSLAFMVLTVMQLTQSFFARSISISVFRTGVTGNRWLVAAWFFSFACLLLGTYLPGFSDLLGLENIGGPGWGIVFACVAIQFAFVEGVKWIYRAWGRRMGRLGRDGGHYTEMAEEVRV